jgi:predicted PolB exonuclease-like 3'-5' exonuclease
MDMLSGYQTRAAAPLDEVASLLGLPGKMGMSGTKVWDLFQNGEIEAIRNYCETDVLNTYLIFLRFELIRGHINQDTYEQECQLVRKVIEAESKAHFLEFLRLWN